MSAPRPPHNFLRHLGACIHAIHVSPIIMLRSTSHCPSFCICVRKCMIVQSASSLSSALAVIMFARSCSLLVLAFATLCCRCQPRRFDPRTVLYHRHKSPHPSPSSATIPSHGRFHSTRSSTTLQRNANATVMNVYPRAEDPAGAF